MRDCINAIEDRETDELSNYEVNALTNFLDLAREITNLEYEIEEILGEYDRLITTVGLTTLLGVLT